MCDLDHIRVSSASDPAFQTPLSSYATQKNRDKFRGCLIGGAAGDALGYTVEFSSEASIFHSFGPGGITAYVPVGGIARISDDTQMTLFTAAGLLRGVTRNKLRRLPAPLSISIDTAYRDWLWTQELSHKEFHSAGHSFSTWLMQIPELFSPRAPGNTCLSALHSGFSGTPEHHINNSKGCGGVMRVAPIGLCTDLQPKSILAADLLGADAAALTHGHEMGYIPAAMLVHIVRLLSCSDGITPKQAVLDARYAMEMIFASCETLPGFFALIDRAVALSEADIDDLDAIHSLGAGWCGDEALAIAIYCALKYPNDFDRALIASVNHEGDSDSTGAITGNILGAFLGLSAIGSKYTDALEIKDVLLETADDLFFGCPDLPLPERWQEKYVDPCP